MVEVGTVSISTVYGVDYDMTHVGSVIDSFGYAFPVFASKYGYQIDLGGAIGLTDPIEASDASAAISIFEEEIG